MKTANLLAIKQAYGLRHNRRCRREVFGIVVVESVVRLDEDSRKETKCPRPLINHPILVFSKEEVVIGAAIELSWYVMRLDITCKP